MLRCDLKLEMADHKDLKEAAAYCESVGDDASRELSEEILESEEEHVDWLETQLLLLENLGIQNFLHSTLACPDAGAGVLWQRWVRRSRPQCTTPRAAA